MVAGSCAEADAWAVAALATTSAPMAWKAVAPLNLSGFGCVITSVVIGERVVARMLAISRSASAGVNWASKTTTSRPVSYQWLCVSKPSASDVKVWSRGCCWLASAAKGCRGPAAPPGTWPQALVSKAAARPRVDARRRIIDIGGPFEAA